MNKYAYITIFIGIFLISIISFHQIKKDQNTIIVGTNAEYYPFTFSEDGKIQGFDIDIAKEVCKRLNKKIIVKDMPFETLIPELTLGHVDIAAAGLTYTEEKAKRVFFTKPYLTDDSLVILTYNNTKLTLKDLDKKKVIVNEGYTADLFVSKIQNLDIIRLNSPVDGFLALKSSHADAFVTAKSTLKSFLKKQNSENFYYTEIENSADNYALVISKKKPELLKKIDQILDEMTKDGTIDSIKTKWQL